MRHVDTKDQHSLDRMPPVIVESGDRAEEAPVQVATVRRSATLPRRLIDKQGTVHILDFRYVSIYNSSLMYN